MQWLMLTAVQPGPGVLAGENGAAAQKGCLPAQLAPPESPRQLHEELAPSVPVPLRLEGVALAPPVDVPAWQHDPPLLPYTSEPCVPPKVVARLAGLGRLEGLGQHWAEATEGPGAAALGAATSGWLPPLCRPTRWGGEYPPFAALCATRETR